MERRNLLRAYGAELVLTPGAQGMKGAIARADELGREIAGRLRAAAVREPGEPGGPPAHDGRGDLERHRRQGRHLRGGRRHRRHRSPASARCSRRASRSVDVVAVEPTDSPVLSGGEPGPHKIQGIGAGFVPKVLNTEVYDEVVQVTNEQAFEAARELASEGILVGISAGANAYAAYRGRQPAGERGQARRDRPVRHRRAVPLHGAVRGARAGGGHRRDLTGPACRQKAAGLQGLAQVHAVQPELDPRAYST